MSDRDNKPQPAVYFFRNYNRVVGFAFLAIVLLPLGFFLHQINEKRKEELAIIEGHVERHSQFIEFVLRSSLDYLESLRTAARSHYLDQSRRVSAEAELDAVRHNRLFNLLRKDESATAFDLDALPDRDSGGNTRLMFPVYLYACVCFFLFCYPLARLMQWTRQRLAVRVGSPPH